MKKTLRILHLEDSPVDCELIHEILQANDLPCEIVRHDNGEGFSQALTSEKFDLILADCRLPSFSGLKGLEIARQLAPEIPFIFVSGTIGEEVAVESLRGGATDYVLKDRLARLAPAVRRAMAEREQRLKTREMEERLRQAQRLEAVGTLAGGVAHDFNNILTIIKGHTALLGFEAANEDKVKEIAGTIDRAAGRGAELVKQLLAFARKSDGSFVSTDLNVRVKEIASMLRQAFARNVAFDLQLGHGLPEILADPGQVERVLINLCTNARDAMPSGGRITIQTLRVPGEQVLLRAGGSAGHDYVGLRVIDTGTGMDEETRKHIFEPFFTTKPKGQGTGLGMPVVYGMMKSHNGVIEVESEIGKGTGISLYFPIISGQLPQASKKQPVAAPLGDGSETLLVVDDEVDAIYFLKTLLEAHGYRVLTADDAEEAHRVFRLHASDISLVFSDLGLPGQDGISMGQEMRRHNPNLKLILATGYHDGKVKTRMAEVNVDSFVSKPYDVNDLLRTIRELLDRAKAS